LLLFTPNARALACATGTLRLRERRLCVDLRVFPAAYVMRNCVFIFYFFFSIFIFILFDFTSPHLPSPRRTSQHLSSPHHT